MTSFESKPKLAAKLPRKRFLTCSSAVEIDTMTQRQNLTSAQSPSTKGRITTQSSQLPTRSKTTHELQPAGGEENTLSEASGFAFAHARSKSVAGLTRPALGCHQSPRSDDTAAQDRRHVQTEESSSTALDERGASKHAHFDSENLCPKGSGNGAEAFGISKDFESAFTSERESCSTHMSTQMDSEREMEVDAFFYKIPDYDTTERKEDNAPYGASLAASVACLSIRNMVHAEWESALTDASVPTDTEGMSEVDATRSKSSADNAFIESLHDRGAFSGRSGAINAAAFIDNVTSVHAEQGSTHTHVRGPADSEKEVTLDALCSKDSENARVEHRQDNAVLGARAVSESTKEIDLETLSNDKDCAACTNALAVYRSGDAPSDTPSGPCAAIQDTSEIDLAPLARDGEHRSGHVTIAQVEGHRSNSSVVAMSRKRGGVRLWLDDIGGDLATDAKKTFVSGPPNGAPSAPVLSNVDAQHLSTSWDVASTLTAAGDTFRIDPRDPTVAQCVKPSQWNTYDDARVPTAAGRALLAPSASHEITLRVLAVRAVGDSDKHMPVWFGTVRDRFGARFTDRNLRWDGVVEYVRPGDDAKIYIGAAGSNGERRGSVAIRRRGKRLVESRGAELRSMCVESCGVELPLEISCLVAEFYTARSWDVPHEKDFHVHPRAAVRVCVTTPICGVGFKILSILQTL